MGAGGTRNHVDTRVKPAHDDPQLHKAPCAFASTPIGNFPGQPCACGERTWPGRWGTAAPPTFPSPRVKPAGLRLTGDGSLPLPRVDRIESRTNRRQCEAAHASSELG